MNRLGCEGIFHDQLCLLKPYANVSFLPGLIDKVITRRRQFFGQPFIMHHIRMDERRRRLHCLYRIQHRLKVLIFDLDEIQRLLGYLLAFRRDRRHFFAYEPDHPISQNGHVIDPSADLQSRYILTCNDRLDAREMQGPARIYAFDAPGGNRASQDFAPKHPGQSHVHRILRPSGNLIFALDSRSGNTYDLFYRHHFTSKNYFLGTPP